MPVQHLPSAMAMEASNLDEVRQQVRRTMVLQSAHGASELTDHRPIRPDKGKADGGNLRTNHHYNATKEHKSRSTRQWLVIGQSIIQVEIQHVDKQTAASGANTS